jgi:hypothetical protein
MSLVQKKSEKEEQERDKKGNYNKDRNTEYVGFDFPIQVSTASSSFAM